MTAADSDSAPGSDPSLLRFRALLEAGLAALETRREEVNDLNVFPVPDGDTGDNMVLTLRAVLDELDRLATLSPRSRSSGSAETRSSPPWLAPRSSGPAGPRA